MIYWASTVLVCAILGLSALSYLFHQGAIEGIRELGFPDYFRLQLAVLKLVAVLALILPAVPHQMKEWAYAGAALFFLTAIVAHLAHKDSYWTLLLNVVFLALLVTSRMHLRVPE